VGYLSMKSSNKAGEIQELNKRGNFKYLCTSASQNFYDVSVGISRCDCEVLPNPNPQITGSLNEIHSVYLAIENVLRIEQEVPTGFDVFRTSLNLERKLYQVWKSSGQPSYFHTDKELDPDEVSDSDCSDSRKKGSRDRQDAICAKILQNVMKSDTKSFVYFRTFPDNVHGMDIFISHILKSEYHEDRFKQIRIKTSYYIILNHIVIRSTEMTFTRLEFMALRFALLDFLRCRLPLMVEWHVHRQGVLENYRIESRLHSDQSAP
jgi:hypothetical protein